jgi:hypothetical protein
MAKAKKTTKAKTSKKAVKKSASRKSVLHKEVDNKLSILLIVAALLVFVLAAVSMGR